MEINYGIVKAKRKEREEYRTVDKDDWQLIDGGNGRSRQVDKRSRKEIKKVKQKEDKEDIA